MASPLAKDEDHKNHGEGCSSSHFLVVAYSIQGHINPARTLAHRLAQLSGCTATLSVPLSGHRRMFPSSSDEDPEAIISDGLISYAPFSDGIDDGTWPSDEEDRARRHESNFRTLSAVVSRLAAAAGGSSRPPVTCVVCTLSLPVVGEVARAHGLPLAFYWIQPATVLATYYHYFHGHDELHQLLLAGGGGGGEVILPGLHRPLRTGDMPTFFFADKTQDGMSKMVLKSMRELFQQMDDQAEKKPVVLVNTFAALEDVALAAVQPYMDVFAVGPAVPVPSKDDDGASGELAQLHLVQQDDDEKKAYVAWLDAQPDKSVVYLSFGSLLGYTPRQAEEVLHGLQATGRPYLWVVRREGRAEEVADLCLTAAAGMVVAWCDQQRVLAHPSVGCFVTHGGWNSTLEALVCGVPMVAVPSWSDQPVNAWLVEEEWQVGVRAERDGEGVLTRGELARCVELVMGAGGDRAAQVRASASGLKERAKEAVAAGGPLEASLRRFVKSMQDLGPSGK